MESSPPGTFWTYEEAKEKCNERYSCFVEVEAKEHMSLSPYYIGRIKKGVEEEIERKIQRWKFLDEYQGIIVAYDSIKLLQRSAEIHDDSPLIHFDIRVNYIVFKPEIGKKLVGVVNKTSSTHVGCLVYDHFNASLAKPSFSQNGWIGDRLNIGTEFIFRISDLQSVGGLLSIAGQIKDKDAKHFR